MPKMRVILQEPVVPTRWRTIHVIESESPEVIAKSLRAIADDLCPPKKVTRDAER